MVIEIEAFQVAIGLCTLRHARQRW